MDYFSSDFKLGILGGGQLGKMLLSETQKYDIATCVMDTSDEAPAKTSATNFVIGDLLNFDDVYNFGKTVDLLTIEIENVNLDALDKLEAEGLKIFPSSKTLRKIQNKGDQKDLYVQNEIPTAAFQRFTHIEALRKAIEKGDIKYPFVWKAARFGYDGLGVKVVREENDLTALSQDECIAEVLIPFKNELAVIVARSESGQIRTYPVVEMEFHPEANQVEYVICPARIDDQITQKAHEIAMRVSETIDHVGLLAVEMFLTEDDEILVNEVAPRSHNSGHYSIEASYTSQFENHLRAILNLPLGNTQSKLAAVMVNLVGAEGFNGKVHYLNIDKIMQIDGVTPHIYGKKITKPFRKMGHVTIINSDMKKAREIAQEVKETIRVMSYEL